MARSLAAALDSHRVLVPQQMNFDGNPPDQLRARSLLLPLLGGMLIVWLAVGVVAGTAAFFDSHLAQDSSGYVKGWRGFRTGFVFFMLMGGFTLIGAVPGIPLGLWLRRRWLARQGKERMPAV